jgi:hypothetical protein
LEVDLAILLVRGFIKPRLSWRGIPAYYRKLKKRVGPNVFVKMYDWDSVDEIVEDILRIRPHDTIGRVHSYGMSSLCFSALRLYDAWPEFVISHTLSMDGVGRDDPYRIDIDSMKPGMVIDVPGNMRFVDAKRQEDPDCIINGHKLRAMEPEKTNIVEEIIKGVDHWNFDWRIEQWV